jgi:hypothetical protein
MDTLIHTLMEAYKNYLMCLLSVVGALYNKYHIKMFEEVDADGRRTRRGGGGARNRLVH